MAILMTVETFILALLALLVAGLLRSHAEILRRLDVRSKEPARSGPEVDPHLPPARDMVTPSFDLAGTDLAGDPIEVAVRGARSSTLLAFLSSGCLPCQELFRGLREGTVAVPGAARVVVVARDRDVESPSKLRDLLPTEVTTVMSSAAWEEYGVRGSPYFIYVRAGTGEVLGEGTAGHWDQVASLIRDALADTGEWDAGELDAASRPPGGRDERMRWVDERLAAAGIGPDHPSLRRAGRGGEDP